MPKFKLGQKVTYLRLNKVGTIVRVDVGLGYYLECNGSTWSVPEEAISAKAPKRYKTRRNAIKVQKAQLEKLNDFNKNCSLKIPKIDLNRSISECEGVRGKKTVEPPRMAKKHSKVGRHE